MSRKWMIITGIPLALGNLGMAFYAAGIYAVGAACGTWLAIRVVELIFEELEEQK